MASDVAFNWYYERDTRRAYPRTSVVTQPELSALIASSPALKIASPESSQTAITAESAPPLTSVIEALPVGRSYVAAGIQTGESDGLPPVAPTSRLGGKWVPRPGQEIPHGKYAYFPISGYN